MHVYDLFVLTTCPYSRCILRRMLAPTNEPINTVLLTGRAIFTGIANAIDLAPSRSVSSKA
jgi:hypothetical protein